jgi:hypothetical protein
MQSDGSVELEALADWMREPAAFRLEGALFSFDHDRKVYMFEIITDLAPPAGHDHPQIWLRATRKHTVEVVA